MRIDKKKYDELLRTYEVLQGKYDRSNEYNMHLLHELDYALTSNDELKSDNLKLLEQVTIYKKKYADEVQKRLELVKLIENNT